MNKYKVKLHIIGSPWRPTYTGNVIVGAGTLVEAIQRAIHKLRCRDGAFWDVPPDSFRVLETTIIK